MVWICFSVYGLGFAFSWSSHSWRYFSRLFWYSAELSSVSLGVVKGVVGWMEAQQNTGGIVSGLESCADDVADCSGGADGGGCAWDPDL